MPEVGLDGWHAHEQSRGGLLVGEPVGDNSGDLGFGRCQSGPTRDRPNSLPARPTCVRRRFLQRECPALVRSRRQLAEVRVPVPVAPVLPRGLGGAGQPRRFIGRTCPGRADRQTLQRVDPEETETVFARHGQQIVPMPLGGVVVAAEQCEDAVGEAHEAAHALIVVGGEVLDDCPFRGDPLGVAGSDREVGRLPLDEAATGHRTDDAVTKGRLDHRPSGRGILQHAEMSRSDGRVATRDLALGALAERRGRPRQHVTIAGEERNTSDALVGHVRERVHPRTVRWSEVRQLILRPARRSAELATNERDLGRAADNRRQREVVARVTLGCQQLLGGGEPAGRSRSSELRSPARADPNSGCRPRRTARSRPRSLPDPSWSRTRREMRDSLE